MIQFRDDSLTSPFEAAGDLMSFGKKLTITGTVLVFWAWWNAGGIPAEAHRDFDRLVQANAGRMSHTPDFPDVYKQMSADRRILQNVYVGTAGLICLAVGLTTMRSEAGGLRIDMPRIPTDSPDATSRT